MAHPSYAQQLLNPQSLGSSYPHHQSLLITRVQIQSIPLVKLLERVSVSVEKAAWKFRQGEKR